MTLDNETNLLSTYSEYCVISNAAGATKISITEAKLYVSVSIVALSYVKIFSLVCSVLIIQ